MEKTRRLFDEDSYIKEFDGIVWECLPADDGYEVVLDRTAFFPEGGGQDSDGGDIDGISVLHVRESDGVIFHFTKAPLHVGKTIHGKIDFEERFRRMQNHTAEHILAGLAHSFYGYENVGFHLSDEYVRVDFDGELDGEQILRLELEVNKSIAENHSVRAWYPAEEDLLNTWFRSKKDICKNLRLVEIENVDCCACCAPHVSSTGQIGVFKIIDFMRYKGGCRIQMAAGSDAVKLFLCEHDILSGAAASFSVKREEIPEVLRRFSEENNNLKKEVSHLRKEVLFGMISSVCDAEGNVCLFADGGYDGADLREAVNYAVSRCKGVAAVFSGDDKVGYKYAAGSQRENMREFCRVMNSSLDGKGGGSENMVQGSVFAPRKKIESFFK